MTPENESARRRVSRAVLGMAGSAEESLDGTRPALGVLADQPVANDRDDLLGYGDFADALAELIDHDDTATPLTIAISGPWGAGKTTLAKLVERRLKAWPAQRGDRQHTMRRRSSGRARSGGVLAGHGGQRAEAAVAAVQAGALDA
jgi:pantothenate kinase